MREAAGRISRAAAGRHFQDSSSSCQYLASSNSQSSDPDRPTCASRGLVSRLFVILIPPASGLQNPPPVDPDRPTLRRRADSSSSASSAPATDPRRPKPPSGAPIRTGRTWFTVSRRRRMRISTCRAHGVPPGPAANDRGFRRRARGNRIRSYICGPTRRSGKDAAANGARGRQRDRGHEPR